MPLCVIPSATYFAYLMYFFWFSKRQKALEPLMANNEDYKQLYKIVVLLLFSDRNRRDSITRSSYSTTLSSGHCSSSCGTSPRTLTWRR